jgi:hypothetical protein
LDCMTWEYLTYIHTYMHIYIHNRQKQEKWWSGVVQLSWRAYTWRACSLFEDNDCTQINYSKKLLWGLLLEVLFSSAYPLPYEWRWMDDGDFNIICNIYTVFRICRFMDVPLSHGTNLT